MRKLTPRDLYSLEKYIEIRPQFRAQVMAHKRNRQVPIGLHVTLYFEDRLTIQYQIQEMLRIERITDIRGIEEEIAAYSPLIPDGQNWKATLMIEYSDSHERRQALTRLVGVEKRVWVKVAECEPSWAIADEDLDRESNEKTSAVHFLRFELSPSAIAAVKAGKAVGAGIDHAAYQHTIVALPEIVRVSLAADID